MEYKVEFQRRFKLVDNGNSTQNLHSLCFQNGILFSEIDCGNVEDILIKNKKLQNNWNELKKLLKEEKDICDGCIDTLRSDLQELHPRSCGKTYLQNEILKNKTAKRSFEITLDKMQKMEGNND